MYVILTLVARSISDDLSSGDAARFRDDEYGKSESTSGMGSSSARNESAHKGERDKEKKEKDKEEFEGRHKFISCGYSKFTDYFFLCPSFQKQLKSLMEIVHYADEYFVQSLFLEHAIWSNY